MSNESLVALVAELKALVFIPSQLISRQGMPLSAAYFINKGIVQIYTHDALHGTLTNTDNVRRSLSRNLQSICAPLARISRDNVHAHTRCCGVCIRAGPMQP